MQVERNPQGFSGARVRNTWVICPEDRDNSAKAELIPDKPTGRNRPEGKRGKTLLDEPAAHQLVGGVTAHQGNDG